MEHLLLRLDHDLLKKEAVKIYNADILECDWYSDEVKKFAISPVEPFTEWLGYNYDNSEDQAVGLELDTYAKQRGWNFEAIFRGNLRAAHHSLADEGVDLRMVGRRVAAFVQGWLYIGLLELMLEKRVRMSFVTQTHDGTLYINSQNVLPFLEAYDIIVLLQGVSKETLKDVGELESEGASDSVRDDLEARLRRGSAKIVTDKVERNLSTAKFAISHLAALTDMSLGGKETQKNYPGFCESITKILPSIIRLREAITIANEKWTGFTSERRVKTIGYEESACVERNRRLKQRGWCPSLINNLQCHAYSSCLDWVDGTLAQSPSDGHRDCGLERCVRNNVDPDTYVLRHVDFDCKCGFVKPSVEEVIMIIETGEIPVITVQESDDSVRLLVSRCSGSSAGEYIALSHVWVDGLGSTSQAGIPECQARRLGRLVHDASDGVNNAFWIDSLCIPTGKASRKKSIAMMKNIYRNADKVLVIDQTVRRCSKSASLEEISWAILASSWMQRAWTFQEGYLARSLIFETLDGFYALPEEPEISSTSCIRLIQSGFQMILQNLRPKKGSALSASANFGIVSWALNWRSTSKAEDELPAIAPLVNVDPGILIGLEGEQKTQAFYQLLGNLPYDIFLHQGPKMTTPGFRWAPRSLMVQSTYLPTFGRMQTTKCTSNGLKFEGWILSLQECFPLPTVIGQLAVVQERTEGTRYVIQRMHIARMEYKAGFFNTVIMVSPRDYDLTNGCPAAVGLSSPDGTDPLECEFVGLVYIMSAPRPGPFVDCTWAKRKLLIT